MRLVELSEKDKALLDEGSILPIMEQFYTIQGEGSHTGKAAYFVRIGGCDVGCHWCDVKESWDASTHPLVPIDSVLQYALSHPARTIVITGGEPLTFNLERLTSELKREGFQVHVETSGAHPFSGKFDWVCLSPKKTAPPLPIYYEKADELKVIIYNRNDFDWAEEHARRVSKNCKLYLQPEWSKRDEMMPLIIERIMEDPRWNMSLQSHKYMNIP